MQWAYSAVAPLPRELNQNWASPHTPNSGVQPLIDATHHFSKRYVDEYRPKIGSGHPQVCRAAKVVAYDGRRWLIGMTADPASLLDEARYPPEHFTCGLFGQTLFAQHAYVSDAPTFPEMVPHVTLEHAANLHNTHIVPIAEQSRNAGERGAFNQQYAEELHRGVNTLNKTTNFSPVSDSGCHEIGIDQFVPADAVSALKKAHAEGKPIAIVVNDATQEWARHEQFGHALSDKCRLAEQAERRAVASEAAKTAKAASSRSTKIAIAAGAVGIGAVTAYWIWRRTHPSATCVEEEKLSAAGAHSRG